MGQLLGNSGAQAPQGGAGGGASLLTAIPGILNSFKGVNTKAQSNIAGQQANVANAYYNPSNPLYQQLYGQERQNIQQTGAQQIAQAGNQNRLLSSMGRTPLFSQDRNGEEAFRQSVMNQDSSDLQAQNATRGILGGAMTGLNGALEGANNRNVLQYGASRTLQGSNNQTPIGFNSIGQFLQGMGGNNSYAQQLNPLRQNLQSPFNQNNGGY